MIKYLYSVLTLVDYLHGAVVGTGDGMPADKMQELVSWLEWRVGDGWSSSFKEHEAYENAVRELARVAVAEARAYLDGK